MKKSEGHGNLPVSRLAGRQKPKEYHFEDFLGLGINKLMTMKKIFSLFRDAKINYKLCNEKNKLFFRFQLFHWSGQPSETIQ